MTSTRARSFPRLFSTSTRTTSAERTETSPARPRGRGGSAIPQLRNEASSVQRRETVQRFATEDRDTPANCLEPLLSDNNERELALRRSHTRLMNQLTTARLRRFAAMLTGVVRVFNVARKSVRRKTGYPEPEVTIRDRESSNVAHAPTRRSMAFGADRRARFPLARPIARLPPLTTNLWR